MKIERACQLLTTTNMRINQICHKVGIDDSYYFSRLFKKETGLSPKQYRMTHYKAAST
jgi:YesN/AraC family two-component response regulator